MTHVLLRLVQEPRLVNPIWDQEVGGWGQSEGDRTFDNVKHLPADKLGGMYLRETICQNTAFVSILAP